MRLRSICGRKVLPSKIELLFARNINYNDVPQWQKRGVGIYSKEYVRQGYNPISEKCSIRKKERALRQIMNCP